MTHSSSWDRTLVATVLGGIVAVAGLGVADAQMIGQPPPVSYQRDVQPLLNEHCVECHTSSGEVWDQTGLDLSTYEAVMKGTKHGAVVVPGDALRSNLVALIEGRSYLSVRMPHNQQRLSKDEKNTLRRWVYQGAKNN